MSTTPERIAAVEGLIEVLRRLRDASDAAAPGVAYTCGPPWFRNASGVLIGSPDPHAGTFIADTDCSFVEGDDREDIDDDATATFIAEAWNFARLILARPDLLAALRTSEPTSPSGGDGGAEAMRIPSFGFVRGAVVRETVDGPNMLVVRGLGETTVVIVIEGDESGKVRLRERPTAALTQVYEPGDYARHRRSPADWEPPTDPLPQDQAPRQGGERP